MGSDSPPWNLTIPSDLSSLPTVRAFLTSTCQINGLDPATTDAIVLAVNEAVNNIVRHAHAGRPDAPVRIECALCSNGLEVRLLDEGAPFDLNAVPRLNPAEVRVGGRGVFLMRSLMDEITCEPRTERGNLLRMVKHCSPKPAPDVAS